MRDKVLDKLNNRSDSKVTIGFKIDPYTKSLFEKVCAHDGYKISSILNVMTNTYIEEFFESEYKEIRKILKKIDDIHLNVDNVDNTLEDLERMIVELQDLKERLFIEQKRVFALNEVDTQVSTDDGDYYEKLIPSTDSLYYNDLIDPMSILGIMSGQVRALNKLKEIKLKDK